MSRFNWFMVLFSLTGIAGLCIRASWEKISVLPYLLPFFIIAWYCDWAGHHHIRDLLVVITWALSVPLLIGPFVEIAGSSPFPLVDQAFGKADLFQTASVVNWLRPHPWLSMASAISYLSLFPLAALALLIPALCGQFQAARRLVVSVALGLLMTVLLFALLPAAGPWTVESYRPNQEQIAAAAQLVSLKSGDFTGHEIHSIVSFPSFHTILAILGAFALWPIRWVRYLGWIVCTAVCVSTITTGWHYGLDVAGGLVVAIVAQLVTNRWIVRDPFIA